jgi:hypothetical protein
VAAVPAAGAPAAECARQREDHEHQDVHGRTERPGWIRRAIAGSARHSRRLWPGRAPAKGDAGVGAACMLRRATASGLAGWLLRAHRPVAAAEDAGGQVSHTACGRVPWCRSRWRRVRRRSRSAGIPPGLLSPGGFPGLGWPSGRSRAAEMPGPEQVTDLPAPPQEGRPMRPAGGEQAGQVGSPPGCWCSRPGGNRR